MKQALSVFENTHDGITIIDSSKKYWVLTLHLQKTTGYTLKDLILLTLLSISLKFKCLVIS